MCSGNQLPSMVFMFTTILVIIPFYFNMLFLSSYWPTNLPKNYLKVNSIYLIVIREINVKSILVFIRDLLRNFINLSRGCKKLENSQCLKTSYLFF